MLADPAVDVVHLTTPNRLHFDAGARRARGRQARRVREAARDDLGRDGRAGATGRRRAASCTRSTSTSASTRSARRRARACARARSATCGSSPAATCRTGCCSTPTGTGGSTRRRAARCARSATSARTGSTSSSSSPAATSRPCCADLHDVHPRAQAADRPGGDVQRRDRRRDRSTRAMETEDAAGILLRLTRRRARRAAPCRRSRPAARTAWLGDRRLGELARLGLGGARGAVDRPPRPAERALLTRCATRRRLPAGPRRGLPGHVQAALPRRLPRGRGRRPAGRARLPDVRRRPRGGRDRRRHRALARRAAVGVACTPVPQEVDEARPAHGGLPDPDPRRDRRLGGGQRLRDARGRVLARRRGRRAPLRGRLPHRRRDARRREGGRDRRRPRAPRPGHLRARLLPEPALARRRGARRRARAPAAGDRGRGDARRRHRRHVRRPRPRAQPARQPRRLPRGVAAARRPRRAARRADRDRELPDDLLLRRVAGRRQPRLRAGDLARDVHGDPGRALRPELRPVAPRLADDRRRARGARVRRPHLPRRTARTSRCGPTASTSTA